MLKWPARTSEVLPRVYVSSVTKTRPRLKGNQRMVGFMYKSLLLTSEGCASLLKVF